MKKIVIGVLISFLMLGSVLAGANTVNYSSEGTDSIELFEIGDGEIKVTFPLGDYEIIRNDNGDEIFLEDFGRNLIPGKPNLPSKIFSVAIPPGAIFKDVSYTYEESVELEDIFYIQPVGLPRLIGEEDPEVYKQGLKNYNENYESTYGKNEKYPLSVVEFVRTSGFRKYNLVDIRVNPFSYNPISGKLTFFTEITALISYTFEDGFTYDDIMVDYNEKTKQVAEKIVHNYNTAKDWYPEGAGSKELYDYVIITLESLTSSVQSLVDWEEEKGRSVKVVTTNWINSYYSGYDLAEKMRNFLRNKYPSEEWGILDVCLIGNYDDVPMRRTWQSVGGQLPETDYYYADLSYPDSQSWDLDVDRKWGETYDDQIDFTAEINVGRIPFSDPSIVENICEKSVSYEMNKNPSFKRNILLLGSFFWNDDPNPRTDNAVLMEYKTDSELHPWMSKWKMTKMYEDGYTTYPMDYNLDWNNVTDVWANGSYAFVNYAGHGSPDACWLYFSHGPFVDTETCTFLNDDYPSIVFADACSNSDTDYFNIGQAMMQQGAVGFLGSTKVAFGMPGWDDPTDGSSQTMDYLFTVSCTSGEYTQGQAHQYALREMYVNGYWYKEHLETFEWGALWGNPDISMANVIENEPPSAPVIDGPSTGSPGIEYCWTFQSNDLEGDKIKYIVDWGDENITETDCDDPNSTIELCYTYIEKGYYNIKAKAVDCENGFESAWSNPKLFVVPRERVVQHPIFVRIIQRLFHLFPLFERLII
jgi:hypothetical protein